ncbi:MAG: VgrG-related protein [Acidimicrobiales bacterium]
MTVRGVATATAEIKVADSTLAASLREVLVSVTVENSLWLPDRVTLVFSDPYREVIEKAGLVIGASLDVSVVTDAGSGSTPLADCEITAMEVEAGPTGARTVIRGLDRTHRLLQGTRTKAYVQVKASDVVSQLAEKAKISVGTVDETTYVHPQLTQANVSDWRFIQQLAADTGFVCHVSKGKLCFSEPTKASSGPSVGTDSSTGALQLVLGRDLVRLRATVRATEQVSQVQVRGWDPKAKQAVVGEDSSPADAGAAATDTSVQPATLAGKIGGRSFVGTSRPTDAQSWATAKAKATGAALAGASTELEGECLGNPELVAGVAFSLGGAGKPFDGKYVASTTRHVFTADTGYTTWFTVSGWRDPSLLAAASGSTFPVSRPVPGVVPGVVTDVKDEQSEGRVKVKFPWLDDDYVTDWVRTVQIGASSGYGFLVLPEVNDEVLVAFEQGDLGRPYVIGNLYNGVDKPKAPATTVDSGTGKVDERRLMSRLKHEVLFLDGTSKSGITIRTGDDKESIVIDAKEMSVTIKATGEVVIQGKTVTVKGQEKISLQAAEIAIQAKGKLAMSAEGQASVQAQGELQLSSSGITSVKGSLVKIN